MTIKVQFKALDIEQFEGLLLQIVSLANRDPFCPPDCIIAIILLLLLFSYWRVIVALSVLLC